LELGTFGDGFFDEFLFAEGGSLEEFLEADDVVRGNLIKNVVNAFVFVVVVVGLDGRRPEEKVVSQEPDIFSLSRHGTIV
jgi:hypothetical protein